MSTDVPGAQNVDTLLTKHSITHEHRQIMSLHTSAPGIQRWIDSSSLRMGRMKSQSVGVLESSKRVGMGESWHAKWRKLLTATPV